jgi:integrase
MMPTLKRHSTKYPGVYFIDGTSLSNSKPERIYYIRYRKNGKSVEEKAGRQFQDDMTPARAALLRSEKINGTYMTNKEKRISDSSSKPFSALWTIYQTDKSINAGIRNDRYQYNKYLKDEIGHLIPHEIQPRKIDKLKRKLSVNLAPQTVANILSLIRRIINYAVKCQLCSPLTFKIELPKFDNSKTEDLAEEQLSRLLDVLEMEANQSIARIMKMALYTGMRKMEIFRLRWSDVDFERGFITIREPKGLVTQTIPINNSARSTLINQGKTPGTDLVFPNKDGKIRDNIFRATNRIRKAAGLPKDFRPLHGLRHVYASMLASSGKVDMYTLQKLLTHKSPQMTQRYAHLRDETLKKAASVIDEIFDVTKS